MLSIDIQYIKVLWNRDEHRRNSYSPKQFTYFHYLPQKQAVRLCHTSLVPITVVRHKLRIIEENSSSYLWYKDEGWYYIHAFVYVCMYVCV